MNYSEEAPHYLLDAKIISELIKPEPNFGVISKIAEHASDCAICAPVWEELKFGVYLLEDGIKKQYLEKFICEDVRDNFTIKSYTERAADIHAMLRSKLQKAGAPTQKSDSMIAAVALANNMILVTRNIKHFSEIQKICNLQIENWFE